MNKLVLNKENVEKIQAGRSLRDFAADLGLDASTMSRVLNGLAEPGPRVITAFIVTYPYKFEHFFAVSDAA